ncbi:hypothetical protein HNO88_002265 [Novosphingobium chloroacetimidivorans]|uniref:Uncharacterized protein n=1 Tax=Novosphingobium chloroacetimidivorans TaxID=1428314 RepID=A0A7W7KAY8_9SPHN|nr:hypothetical protein [Novosphingobium chloroacetimidivorans]MBB4858939.1 hypothetical protein [Novosphingobium chloroacetimidivorans]
MRSTRKLVLFAALGAAAAVAAPAAAQTTPNTRLVDCGEESCLLVTGHRERGSDEVRINGHRVDVQGQRNWRVRLPLAKVREWSAPFARRLEVSTHPLASRKDVAQAGTADTARLPIGLLGHVPDLASLVITLD